METSTIVRAMMREDRVESYSARQARKRGGYVRDYAEDYGEPGYRKPSGADESSLILLGDFWCHCAHGSDAEKENARAAEAGTEPRYLHSMEEHYPRIFRTLEERGCEMVWYDEWAIVWNHDGPTLAYRTEPDSYSWQRSIVMDDNGEWMSPETDPGTWIQWAENDSSRCLMGWFPDAALEDAGYTERECELENGWYGVEDDPAEISRRIKEREGNPDVIFKLSGVEQFRVRFCVYVRGEEMPEED